MKTPKLCKLVCFGFILIMIGSCTKMNDFHDEYLKRGELLYVGRVDSADVMPGKKRVQIRYWSSDPKAKKLKIYWKSKTDSLLLDIPAGSGEVPVDILISNLEENNYLFEMFTYDKDMESKSVVFQKSGKTYGDKFQASITTRLIKTAVFLSNGQMEIRWLGEVEKALGTELIYTNKLGVQVEKFIPINESITMLNDVGGNFKYRTIFLPEANAIDEFYTDYTDVNIGTLYELDQTKYAKWNPTGIPYNENSSTYSISKLWDKNVGTWYIQNLPAKLVPANPYSWTFDLGQLVKLNRFKQWQRLTASVVYQIQNIRKFEVWGSESPNVTADYAGWTKLGDFESIKPSASPWGNVSDSDLAYATQGETFIVSAAAPKVRYIRYVVKATWSTGENSTDAAAAVGEVSFFEVR